MTASKASLRRRRIAALLLPVPVLVIAGAVFAVSSATAQAWFDQPLPFSRVSLGQVDITAHATAPGGVEEVTLAVDGVQVQSLAFESAPLVTAQFSWQPEVEKGYSLTVRGRSGQEWGTPASIFVVVGPPVQAGGESACEPEPGTQSSVLLSQDFASDSGPFETYDFDTVAAELRESAFHLTFTGSGDITISEAHQQFGDVCVEADVVDVGPNASGRYGVFCRLPAEGTYYEFFIDSSGRAGTRVGAFLTGGVGSQQPVFHETDAVNTGLGAVNRVRGDCVGSTFTMWVNGQLVGSFEEATTATGDVGFFATSATDSGTDVAFDNFTVFEP